MLSEKQQEQKENLKNEKINYDTFNMMENYAAI